MPVKISEKKQLRDTIIEYCHDQAIVECDCGDIIAAQAYIHTAKIYHSNRIPSVIENKSHVMLRDNHLKALCESYEKIIPQQTINKQRTNGR